MDYSQYINSVIQRGELYLEMERVRQLLILTEQRPRENREEQRARVVHFSRMFKALLAARDARCQPNIRSYI